MSASSQPHKVERLVPSDRAIDPDVAELVGQEILHNRLEPGAWATALAASGGKRQDALALYARIRMQQVASRQRQRRAKARSFEARRLTTCLGIKTVQDLLQRSNRGGQLNLVKPRLSWVWLSILLVGSAGSVASLGRLLSGRVPDRLESMVPVIALFCGVIAVGGVLLLRALLPKRWVMLGWNTGLLAVCTVACFGSLCFGAKLISRTHPDVIQRLAGGAVKEEPAAPVPASAPGEPVRVKPQLAVEAVPNTTAALEPVDAVEAVE